MRVAGLYAILDLPHPHGANPVELARAFVEGGASSIQLRAKRASHEDRLAILRAIAPLCQADGVSLWVNDDIAAAEAILAADPSRLLRVQLGVHLGQSDLAALGPAPALRIRRLREAGLGVGISTHTLDQVEAALALGPDYLGFGPVFATHTKRDAEPVVGLELLARACARADVPVVAIGGIGLDAFESVKKAGAAAIAVIGALIADTPEQTRARCHALASRLA